MWTEKLEHFQLLHKLNLQIIFQKGNFWNFAGKEYQRELMKETQMWSFDFWVRTENVAPDRMPERIDERNTKVVYYVLEHNRKRFPRENGWEQHKGCLLSVGLEQKTLPSENIRENRREQHKGCLLSVGPQQLMFPQRESMRETQRLSIVCWATTVNVSPERINERNTKVVYCLLGKNRKRFPRENTRDNRWEKHKGCQLSVGQEQKTLAQREYQR